MKKIKIVKEGKRYMLMRKTLFGFTKWFRTNKQRYVVDFSSYADAQTFIFKTYDNVRIIYGR